MERKIVPGYNVMGVCKAALEASMRYMAYDLGADGHRVNALSAGPVKTISGVGAGVGPMLKMYEHVAPMGRNITLEEVGDSGAFLLSGHVGRDFGGKSCTLTADITPWVLQDDWFSSFQKTDFSFVNVNENEASDIPSVEHDSGNFFGLLISNMKQRTSINTPVDILESGHTGFRNVLTG